MIITAHVSRHKENPSFTPDTAKSYKGTGRKKPWVLLSGKYWNKRDETRKIKNNKHIKFLGVRRPKSKSFTLTVVCITSSTF